MPEPTLTELQAHIARFTTTHGLDTDAAHRLLDLQSEIGEVAKELLKATDYGHQPFVPANSWREEIGDVLFALICLANQTDMNLNESLRTVY